MNQMMKQVQQLQAEMAKAQEELKNEVVEGSAGGGMVTVTVSGDLELRDVKIDPEAVDPEDVEMLQDMVLAATGQALAAARPSRSESSVPPPEASEVPAASAGSA